MKKAIAIDFDGCLCQNAYPGIGSPNWPVINKALAEQDDGAGLILWTCREGKLLQDAAGCCHGLLELGPALRRDQRKPPRMD